MIGFEPRRGSGQQCANGEEAWEFVPLLHRPDKNIDLFVLRDQRDHAISVLQKASMSAVAAPLRSTKNNLCSNALLSLLHSVHA